MESARQIQEIRVERIHTRLHEEAERLRSIRNYAEYLIRVPAFHLNPPDRDLLSAYARRNEKTWSLPSQNAASIYGVSKAELEALDGFSRRDAELLPGLAVARSLGHFLSAAPEGSELLRRTAYVSTNGFVVTRPSLLEPDIVGVLRRYATAPYFLANLPAANRDHSLKWHLARAADGSQDIALFLSVPVYAASTLRGVAILEIPRRSLDDDLSQAPLYGSRSYLITHSGVLVGASARNVRRGETLGAALGNGLPADAVATIFSAESGMLDVGGGDRLIFRRVGDSGLALVDVVSTRELLLSSAARLMGVIGSGAAALGILMFATLMVVRTLFKHYLASGEALRALAETDSLTGLANRRVFASRFAIEYAHCERERLPVSVIMLDIDHFKQVNDKWGHASGDIVLQQLAAVLRNNVRNVDVPARLGGEEFGILLSRTCVADAAAVAEQLRQAVQDLACEPSVDAMDKGIIRFTASFGVAEIVPDGTNDLDSLLTAADQRLYAAKAGGRNRVVAQ